jgi:CheY-like chemotaxis protein
MKLGRVGRLTLSVVLLALASVRWLWYDAVSARMDTVFLGLVVAALVIPLIPWEHLRSFKAAGVELTLEQPQVQAAIAGLALDKIEDDRLRSRLARVGKDLESIRGSRILWIDDRPHNILGVRRLLRALGIHIVSAISSEAAGEILETDNDFDLLVTDVQRLGESHKVTGGKILHEGVNYVVRLRGHPDPNIAQMPVIFYSGYDEWQKLVEYTRPARELLPEPEISRATPDFVMKAVITLAEVRATPIPYSEYKRPTRLVKEDENRQSDAGSQMSDVG